MVRLYWRWGDSPEHTERSAPYASVDAARAQAQHDLYLAEAAADYSTAPLRIMDSGGAVVWTANLPDGE